MVEGKALYSNSCCRMTTAFMELICLFSVFGWLWKRLFIPSTDLHTKWKIRKRTNLLKPTKTTGFTYATL